MPRKLTVLVLCGGRSAEHEISLLSARNVVAALDPRKYVVAVVGIDTHGRWFRRDSARFLRHAEDAQRVALQPSRDEVALVPGPARLMSLRAGGALRIDVVFPVLHGPLGEDGTVQGLLKLAAVPFVGAGVLGSAVGMDKDVMKRLLRDAGIPTARFVTVDTRTRGAWPYARIARTLGKTIFVKPANLGSSVGISKAASEREYAAALRLAFRYDTKVLVEECVHGREIECSVLGNERPAASLPGEIVPRHEFYSYEAKYIDDEGARLLVPAALPARSVRRIQDVAVRTFVALGCEGLGRVDLFLRPNGQVVVNEINTIPGFTRISMYPKMWEVSGLSCGALVDRLIALAVARHARDERLRTSYR